MFAIRLIGVLALVALNGFFAAAEFSLVAVRLSRVRQLARKGDVRARVVEGLLGDLHRVVSAVQLGITLTSLALGALGESTLAAMIRSVMPVTSDSRVTLLVHAVALGLAFAMLSALHVVIGELVPKTVSLARAERVALLIARPFSWFLKTFRWAIDLLDGISGAIVHALGVSEAQVPSAVHSTEELQIQIQQARERGLLAPGEEKFIVSAIELGQVQVREIMVPRPDMHTLSVESTLDEVLRAFAITQRSRIPVYRGTEDQILGFVHVKDMLWVLLDLFRRRRSICVACCARYSSSQRQNPQASCSWSCARITSAWLSSSMNSAAFSASSPWRTSSSKSSEKFTTNSTSSNARAPSPTAPSFSTPR